jgi:uncharacterized damage-inducible protein DinB
MDNPINRTRIQAVLEEFDSVVYGTPWYGKSVSEAMETISIEMAMKKSLSARSAAELLAHMNQWRKFVLAKLQGQADFDISEDAGEAWPSIDPLQFTRWSKLKAEYFSVHQSIVQEISGWEDSALDHRVPGRSYTFGFLLNGVIQHDIYHLGQILLTIK